METIFIQIASYRDPELVKTIHNAIKKAKYPERLRFGICWQYDEGEKLGAYETDLRIRYQKIPWREAKGVGWARSVCNKLYQYEDFTLQIDSHHRFADNWDELLIAHWKSCEHPKAVLTGYPPGYVYDENGAEILNEMPPMNLIVKGFDYGYIPTFKSGAIPKARNLLKPYRGSFIAAGFMFTVGRVCEEVPYCKDIYFIGEEIVHSVRLFTYGYRVYHPIYWYVWHLYERKESHKHWIDFSDVNLKSVYNEAQAKSGATVRSILEGKRPELLGDQFSIQDFEMWSGVNFSCRVVHPSHLQGGQPPFEHSKGWENRVKPIKEFQVRMELNTTQIPDLKDYTFWYLGFHDKDCNELVRDDFKVVGTDLFGKVDVVYYKKILCREKPTKYIIWPYSKSLGWQERLVYDIPEGAIF